MRPLGAAVAVNGCEPVCRLRLVVKEREGLRPEEKGEVGCCCVANPAIDDRAGDEADDGKVRVAEAGEGVLPSAERAAAAETEMLMLRECLRVLLRRACMADGAPLALC